MMMVYGRGGDAHPCLPTVHTSLFQNKNYAPLTDGFVIVCIRLCVASHPLLFARGEIFCREFSKKLLTMP